MSNVQILDARGNPVKGNPYKAAAGGHSGELNSWGARSLSANKALLPNQEKLNARAQDMIRNSGVAKSGLDVHVDFIVGHQWRFISKPDWELLGLTKLQGERLARDIQQRFTDYAEDPDCLIDAEEKRTLTMIAREIVSTHTQTGDVFSRSEWIRSRNRRYNTAIKMVDGNRVATPPEKLMNNFIRGGILENRHGAARGYFVRTRHKSEDPAFGQIAQFNYVPKRLPWGRKQLIHTFEPNGDGASRGSNALVSVLSQLPSLSKLQNATLQNAIINAMYAAVIKSDMSPEIAQAVMGGHSDQAANLMTDKMKWHQAADITFDGQQIPHLFPGEEIELLTAQTSGQAFGDFEASFLRDFARGTGVSYELLSRDWSKTNYSSGRAGLLQTVKHLLGKREVIVKRHTNDIMALWLEEAINKGVIKLPATAPSFYEAKAAYCRGDWIGAGRLNIDGLKEIKEAIAKLEAGLSSYELESANLGCDWTDLKASQDREEKELAEQGRIPLWKQGKGKAPEPEADDEEAGDEDDQSITDEDHPQTETYDTDKDK